METFKKYKLGSIASIQTGPFGSQLHNEDYVEIGTPIVTVEHLGQREFSTQNLPNVSDYDKKRLSRYTLETGDIVFSRVGSVDRCSLVSENENGWLFSGRCLRVKPFGIDSVYLYYYFNLENVKCYIRNKAVGATMPSLNTEIMQKFDIFTPPLPTQQKIASILSAYDNLIQNYKKQIEDLQTTASELYKEWFVRFRFPGYKTAQFENGIPVGWKVKKFIDEFNILYGKGLTTDELVDEGYPVFGSNGLIGFYSSYMYEQPQVLISCRGASSGVVNISLPKSFITSNSLICELDKRTESNSEYLSFALKAYKLTQYQTGSAQPQITIDNIKKLKLIIPSKDLVVTFKGIINPINEKILYLQQQITNLTQQRDLLLPRLMSGKLELK